LDLEIKVKRLPQVTVGPITDYRPQRLHDPLRIHTPPLASSPEANKQTSKAWVLK
jgi:hypothetical protein